jgi:type II secretory pathway pseudopilin PulG
MSSDGEAGFSLLETLIAFAIAAFALTALVQIYASSADSQRRSIAILQAVELADQRLAALEDRAQLVPGTIGPVAEAGMVWQVDIEPAEAETPTQPPPALVTIRVTISDPDDGRAILTVETARQPASGARGQR